MAVIITRRDMLIGVSALTAAGTAFALTPRNKLNLLKGANLEKAVPDHFGQWQRHNPEGIIKPRDSDSLSAQLYSQIVERIYVTKEGKGIILLIAYGGTQNDMLQLHRPEVCYKAFGFEISDQQPTRLNVASNVAIPAKNLIASTLDRTEYITYWTRLGEFLPVSGSEQREAKFRNQFMGIVPDGVLVRISTLADNAQEAFAFNAEFAKEFLQTLSSSILPALIGTSYAQLLKADQKA